MSDSNGAVQYDPYDWDVDTDPYPTFKRMRDEAPLYYNEKYVVFSGKRREYQLVYDVLGESNPDSSLVIKLIGANADVALTDKLVFSSDRNTIEVYRTGLSYKLKFSYLDERREPDGYVARQPTAITAQDRAVP